MAKLKYDQGEIAEAITLCQQLGEIYKETGDLRSQAANFHQLAYCYAIRDTKKAKKLFHQSFVINDRIDNMQGKAYNSEGLARICEKEGQIQESITLYKQSLEIANYIGDMGLQASILAMMGQLLADNAENKDDRKEGLAYLKQSLTIFQNLDYPDDILLVEHMINQLQW